MNKTHSKIIFFPWVLLLLLFASCLPKQEVLKRPSGAAGRGSATTTRQPPAVSKTGLDYITRYRQIAIDEMRAHGIPASIKLAQGLLESGNGNSRLAREANNHFGIKCASDWKGPRIYHDDDKRDDCFRSYATAEESFRDHSRFLLRQRYEKLFTLAPGDYRGWARGLKAAGYATNPRYAELLIDLIERYELYQYDTIQTPVRAQLPPQKPQRTPPTQQLPKKTPAPLQIHEVVAGDTAAGIAGKYGLSLSELLDINKLKSSELHPGQLLVVSR